jgi:carnitine-CoA ligase
VNSPGGSVGERLRVLTAASSARPVVSFGAGWISTGELDARSDRLGAGLVKLGIGPGDRVASVLTNRAEAVEITFACAKIGAIAVPLNAYLRGEFLRYQLADSEPSIVVSDRVGVESLGPMRESVSAIKYVACVDEGFGANDADFGYQDLVESSDTAASHAHDAKPHDPLAILYTSGTTGAPKGCVISHGYALNIASAYREFEHARDGDIAMTPLPLFHAAAFGTLMAATVDGSSCVSFEAAFSASTYFARARDIGATVIRGVGAMAAALLATEPSEQDRSHRIERAFFFPLSPPLQVAFEDRFGMAVLSEAWGQTECNPATWARYRDARRRATAGRPLPWIDLRVVDSNDDEVPAGQVGEIVLRGKRPNSLFSGYWRNDAAMVETSRNLWHHSGDYGFLDLDGYLTYLDRKKDALRRRGENVSSLELEAAIAGHPAIDQAAVHAVPSELTEDDIKVCIVLVAGQSVTPDDLFDHFKTTLPYYAIPRYVEIVESLPVNAMGRVQKHKLREVGITATTWDFEVLGLSVGRQERR